jgi:hypothetical protein
VQYWIRAGIVVGHRERYEQYDAWWLDIDEALAIKLERLVSSRHKSPRTSLNASRPLAAMPIG